MSRPSGSHEPPPQTRGSEWRSRLTQLSPKASDESPKARGMKEVMEQAAELSPYSSPAGSPKSTPAGSPYSSPAGCPPRAAISAELRKLQQLNEQLNACRRRNLEQVNQTLNDTRNLMLETTDEQERERLRPTSGKLDSLLTQAEESYSSANEAWSPRSRRAKIFPLIKQLILALDVDGNGFIEKEEFDRLPGLSPLSDSAWAEMVSQADANSDGEVTRPQTYCERWLQVSVEEMAEFTYSSQAEENPPEEDAAWIADLKLMLHALGAPDEQTRSRSKTQHYRSELYPLIERLLRMADTNGDGVLSKEEFEHHTARQMSDEEWTAIRQLVDTDGDGEVQVEEMAEFVYNDAVGQEDFDLEKEVRAFKAQIKNMLPTWVEYRRKPR